MKILLFILSLLLFFTAKSHAADLFTIDVTRNINGQSVNGGFSSVQDLLDYVKGNNLNNVFGTNVDNENLSANINYRGLPANLEYNGNNILTFNVPGIVNKTFTGTNREDLVEQLKDYLKKDGGDIVNQINKKLAAFSPIDPVAGNPTSLMWQMGDNDFALAFSDSLYDTGEVDKNGKKIGNEMGFGAKYINYGAGGVNANLVSLAPFSWRRNLFNSDVKLLLQIPVVTIVSINSAKVYQASSSIGLSIPLYKKIWSIIPMASIGATGSEDLGSASVMRGFSLTNKLHTEIKGFGLSLGTMFGRYNTMPVHISSYKINPDISNNILRNTLAVGFPVTIAYNYGLEANVSNSRYYGSELFIQNAFEYGLGIVKHNRHNASNNEVRFDIKYFSYEAKNVSTIGNGGSRIQGIMAAIKMQY